MSHADPTSLKSLPNLLEIWAISVSVTVLPLLVISVDLTFETPNGLVHIQTVDVDRDGLPTERELRTARRRAQVTRRPVYIVPKTWQQR